MEIDNDYHKGQRFKGGGWLPFIIKKKPKKWDKEEISADSLYHNVDNITLKEEHFSHKKILLDEAKMYSGICLLFSVFIPLVTNFSDVGPLELKYLPIYLTLGLPFLIPAYKKYQSYKNCVENIYVTFDRINSLITMPKMSETEYFTIPFTHLKAVIRSVGARFSYSGPELHFMIEPRAWRPWRHFDYLLMGMSYESKEMWALYVWYMDKNRPLPPGSAFDEYRDEDFNRRKAEGFPLPLFKSMIPTPESTKEQQTEREKYWKDIDFMVP